MDADTASWVRRLTPICERIHALNRQLRPKAILEAPYRFEEIATFEEASGLCLPTQVRALFLCHSRGATHWNNFELLDLDWVPEQIRDLNDLLDEGGVLTAFPGARVQRFGELMLPFGTADEILCLDGNPGPGGQAGQIVEINFEQASCRPVAPDLTGFLEQGIVMLRKHQ